MHYQRAFLLLASTLLVTSACAPSISEQTAPRNPPFVLAVHNAMPETMNISYDLLGAVTALGPVPSGETRRWTVPDYRSSEDPLVFATDEAQHQMRYATIDLKAGQVGVWDLK